MKIHADKDAKGRTLVKVSKDDAPPQTADDRLAALEAWRAEVEKRLQALEKRKNPA